MIEHPINNTKAESEKIDFIHIFKNENYTQSGLDRELSLFGMACFWLAVAIEADEGNNGWLSEEALKLADDVGFNGESWAYNSLRNAAMINIADSWNRAHNETRYYWLFEKHLKKVLGGGAYLSEGRSDPKNRPDKWVKVDGEDIPVEMKKGNFDAKALKQLQRYMKVFNSKAGIAVGRSMTVKCPSNVVFIDTDTLEYLEHLKEQKISLEEILSR